MEIALALGVMAFAFVALMGLLAGGMNVFRDAMDTSVTAEIAQRIAAEIQETDYYTLLRSLGMTDENGAVVKDLGQLPRRYFDDQGAEVIAADAAAPTPAERQRILYEVNVRISREPQVRAASAGGDAAVNSPSLATAVIQVVSNPAGRSLATADRMLFDARALDLPCQTYTTLLARSGSMESLKQP